MIMLNLQILDLSYNDKIENLDGIFGAFKSLSVLRLNGLPLLKNIPTDLPESLAELYLSSCTSITALPDAFVTSHPQLRTIDMSHTGIQIVPLSLAKHASIQTLIFSNCSKLTNVPFAFAQTEKLRMLKLEGCSSLTSPPPAVCKQGFLAVISYMGGNVNEEVAAKEDKCSVM